MLKKLARAYSVMQLTRKYFRPSQVPEECCLYYINRMPKRVYGQYALAMLGEIVLNDCYGLKRFKFLDNIVDIGANIGIFSLHAGTLFPDARILAYEPCNRSRDCLKKNLETLTNATIFSQAVGKTSRTIQLNYQDDLTACYVSSDCESSTLKTQNCEMISFAQVIKQLSGSIGLLKLDCEGSEYEIMKTSAFQSVCYVVGELHTCTAGTPEFGLEILKEQGFIIDLWHPFADGKAGEFWASNTRNNLEVKNWLI
ncbi:FkbM family methyltransferase [Oscillatoria amoena NRMC-F 0135]|nr:FkbM family methyltransferase [Geitlerinema splendidum]MDL5046849.1 FkbM family methyltransferase [Oscillatoria amoena NRMC-F 0135]